MIDISSNHLKKSNSIDRATNWKFTFVGGSGTQELRTREKTVQCFPLNQSEVGERSIVTQIQLLSDCQFLRQNPILKPGTSVEIISKTANGSVIVRVRDRYLGLGAAIASKVIVLLTNRTHGISDKH